MSTLSLVTAADVARELGCAESTASRTVRALDLGQRVGRITLLTPDDVAALRAKIRPGQPGNPTFGTPEATAIATAARKKAAKRRGKRDSDKIRK